MYLGWYLNSGSGNPQGRQELLVGNIWCARRIRQILRDGEENPCSLVTSTMLKMKIGTSTNASSLSMISTVHSLKSKSSSFSCLRGSILISCIVLLEVFNLKTQSASLAVISLGKSA